MDIHSVKVSKEDIQRVLDESKPAVPGGAAANACDTYKEARPLLKVAISILSFAYPPASTALATAVAILDQACQVKP
jgi:hypothetical protein